MGWGGEFSACHLTINVTQTWPFKRFMQIYCVITATTLFLKWRTSYIPRLPLSFITDFKALHFSKLWEAELKGLNGSDLFKRLFSAPCCFHVKQKAGIYILNGLITYMNQFSSWTTISLHVGLWLNSWFWDSELQKFKILVGKLLLVLPFPTLH